VRKIERGERVKERKKADNQKERERKKAKMETTN
jgi:hypothetical protein